MGAQVTYNSVNWNTEYDFKLLRNGIQGRFGKQAPRDDGFDWPADADVPVSVGMKPGTRRITVKGKISKSTHALVIAELVTFFNDMETIQEAGEFQNLYFEDSATYYWKALPLTWNENFFGSDLTSKYVTFTIVFECHNEIYS